MKKVHKFTVLPKLPENLNPLLEIAYNMWWSWNHEAIDLFRLMDTEIWEKTKHNPVRMLGLLGKEKLKDLSNDEAFINHMINVYNSFLMYKDYSTWYRRKFENSNLLNIVYFSMEFGLHDSIPIYSGGLGVLAGCHMKSASDIGLPLIGIGLMYTYGNFNQYLSSDGWQMEKFKENDFTNLPVKLQKNLIIDIPLDDRLIYARIWKMDVGRVSIYFLDTNFEQNKIEDRNITNYLYVGDRETRVKQEIVLGIGGMKLVEKLGLCPAICHMNEGHSAFLVIEKIKIAMNRYNLNFQEALELTKTSNLFTTHTPVQAGNEVFHEILIDKYLKKYIENTGMPFEYLKSLGKIDSQSSEFNMTVFALRNSCYANGVSKLHGKVSRKMWHILWPQLPVEEVPIDHVTNGVHISSWLSDEFTILFDRYLGPKWKEDPSDAEVWNRIDSIPDAELWRSHLRLKERLIGYVRKKIEDQLKYRKRPHSDIKIAKEVLEPDALTIGFARRFAEYKRAFLIFKNPERLLKILNNKNFPVQLIIAGKAHQSDTVGKEIIKNIINIIRKPEFRRKVVFLEDYDLNVAKYLVQGVDIWLNTPRRPLEASGTSGMKAAVNGVINLSILDGWWDEAFNGENGWAIGNGEEYGGEHEIQDITESMMLYDILENEIVPLFYQKGLDGIPHVWINVMKNSIKTIAPFFNTDRMVKEYTTKFYLKESETLEKLIDDDFFLLKDLIKWKERIKKLWEKVEIKSVLTPTKSELYTNEEFEIVTQIFLGELSEKDISVEIYYGHIDSEDNITNGKFKKMTLIDKNDNNIYTYSVKLAIENSGSFGYNIHILPSHEGLPNKYLEGLIKIG